jgi:putative pyrroloquinoline-quinone binding quinoprotein
VTPNVATRLGRFRAWQVAAVLVLAMLAGAAILLQIRGWSAVEGASGSACGSGSAICPRGAVPVLVISFVAGLVAIPFLIWAVVRWPKLNAGVAAVGLAAGVFAAQALSGGLHGTELRVAWTAPYDAAGSPATEGVWTTGGSVIRVRADQVTSYQAAAGREQWTLAVPGGNAACALSAGSSSSAAVGLVGYGTAGGACDRVLAVDLGTGQQLWSKRVPAGWKGDQGTGFVAIGGDTAVAVTAGAVLGYDLRTGAARWSALTPPGCSDQTLAGARQSVVVLAACGRSFDVINLDPASGKELWRTPVPGQAPGYQFAILSADPVAVADVPPGQPEQVLAFGPAGHLTSTIPIGDLDTSSYRGFGPQIAISGGLLIGVTHPSSGHAGVAAYRLSDGGRQWLTPMPDNVLSLRQDGNQLLAIDQSHPSLALDAISLPNGSPHPIGFLPANIVNPGGASVYASGGQYVVVNLTGRAPTPPVAAVGG